MLRGKVKKYLPVFLNNRFLKSDFLKGSGRTIDLSKKDRVQLAAVLRSKTKWAKQLRKQYA